MIRANVLREIIVEDSNPDDESTLRVYQRDVLDDRDGSADEREVCLDCGVWLTLDDADEFARALLAMVAGIRGEQPQPDPDEPAPTPIRKRAAKKTAAKRPT